MQEQGPRQFWVITPAAAAEMEAVSITEAADRLPKNVRDSLPKGLATQDAEADFGIFQISYNFGIG